MALGASDDDEAMPVPDRSAAGDSAGPARSRHIQDRRQREREQAFLREPRGAAAQRAGSSRIRQPSPTGTEVSPITDCPSREPPPAGQGQHALVAHASAGDSGRDDVGTEVSLDCGHDDTGAEVSREHTQAGESGGQGASPGGARVGPRCCLLCFVCSCACCLFMPNAGALGAGEGWQASTSVSLMVLRTCILLHYTRACEHGFACMLCLCCACLTVIMIMYAGACACVCARTCVCGWECVHVCDTLLHRSPRKRRREEHQVVEPDGRRKTPVSSVAGAGGKGGGTHS